MKHPLQLHLKKCGVGILKEHTTKINKCGGYPAPLCSPLTVILNICLSFFDVVSSVIAVVAIDIAAINIANAEISFD